MTTFSYTTGNPANLVGGGAASMNDIAGPFTDVQTFVNGANIDTSNLATSAKPATLLGPYRTISEGTTQTGNTTPTGVYFPNLGTSIISGGVIVNNTAPLLITLTAADWAVSGLTTRLRVAASTVTNATAAAINFTFGLYPVTLSGASNSIILTAGTVVAGSTVTRTTPAANSAFQDASSDFAAPSNGVYALGVLLSGTAAAGSYIASTMRLEVHHV